MSAKVASDGQWRFFPTDSVPYKFRVAITTYEDKRFYRHFGVDPLALGRAVRQNLASGRVASGASTLTMQTIRLSRGRKARTFREKIIETILATRLEFRYSKEEILALYASHAPFGGNVIGLESAAWYYFGRSAGSLSWGERRHARRTAELARAHPYQAQPGTVARASGTTCWNGYGAAGISTP